MAVSASFKGHAGIIARSSRSLLKPWICTSHPVRPSRRYFCFGRGVTSRMRPAASHGRWTGPGILKIIDSHPPCPSDTRRTYACLRGDAILNAAITCAALSVLIALVVITLSPTHSFRIRLQYDALALRRRNDISSPAPTSPSSSKSVATETCAIGPLP